MSRFVLCLSLLAATAGFAQSAEPPPLVPAEESTAQPAPRGEVFPREHREGTEYAVRFAGRLILQPPAGILAGSLVGLGGVFPAFIIGVMACESRPTNASRSSCLDTALYTGFGVGASLGAGLGVLGMGYLLKGEARTGAVMAGALAGSALATALLITSDRRDTKDHLMLLVLAPTAGATLLYALSDAFFPELSRAVAPGRGDTPQSDEDEYVRVLPMLTPTLSGGIVGGLIGRF
ncbi:hypothetical protein [Hyalangium minutum]|uniref:Uncharacterized protein n=1 Tax=Hyalangium minutum TaxID=394096 RepID=A0A085WAY1_9BACT|nr:hypothetical protein [Hyalangium minutum]KFE64844.1 hypothetical protein DB31_1862 [Hyalangium minutum]